MLMNKIDIDIFQKWNRKSVKALAHSFSAEEIEQMRNYLWDFWYIETTLAETPEETLKKYITYKVMDIIKNGQIDCIDNAVNVWAYALK